MALALVSFLSLQLDLGVKPPRSWHIACTHYPTVGQTEVFLFGGNVHIKPDENERMDTADLRILSWGGCALVTRVQGLEQLECAVIVIQWNCLRMCA